MAAAAIVAIRKKIGSFGHSQSDEKHNLLGTLPSRESRELDIELGMLLLGSVLNIRFLFFGRGIFSEFQ